MGRKWMIGKPNTKPVMYGDKKFHELEWGAYSSLIKSRDEKEVERAVLWIDQLVETPRFGEKVKNLIKREDEIYRINREDFETKIKDVIRSIELGNIFKGKCRFCP